jgi:uncharacterized coiled-coil DUF342 family protein
MSDTPETDAFFFRIDIDLDMEVDFARKLERERDEAITRRIETIMQCELYEQERDEAINAIRETLEENRHLSDGDDCTLRKLKAIVPDWK